jgi:hypothetical protein
MQVLILVKHAVSVFTHHNCGFLKKIQRIDFDIIFMILKKKLKKLQNSNNLRLKPLLVLNGVFMKKCGFFLRFLEV